MYFFHCADTFNIYSYVPHSLLWCFFYDKLYNLWLNDLLRIIHKYWHYRILVRVRNTQKHHQNFVCWICTKSFPGMVNAFQYFRFVRFQSLVYSERMNQIRKQAKLCNEQVKPKYNNYITCRETKYRRRIFPQRSTHLAIYQGDITISIRCLSHHKLLCACTPTKQINLEDFTK